MSNGLTAAYAYKLACKRGLLPRSFAMRGCLGAAIRRDWHQHDRPHSKNKGNALRLSELSVVRKCPNDARQADRVSVKAIITVKGSLQKLGQREAIPRVPRMSGGPPPQRIFAHTGLAEPFTVQRICPSATFATSAYDRELRVALPKKRMELHNAWPCPHRRENLHRLQSVSAVTGATLDIVLTFQLVVAIVIALFVAYNVFHYVLVSLGDSTEGCEQDRPRVESIRAAPTDRVDTAAERLSQARRREAYI